MHDHEAKLAERPNRSLGDAPMAGRESAIGALRNQVERLRREAHALEALSYQLDHMVLTSEAEQALWQLVVNSRRI